MADVDTYQRITLKFETPYARRDGDHQLWQLKFSLSGVDMTDHDTITTTAADLAAPILLLTSPETSYTGFLYYQHGSNVNFFQSTFDYGANPGTGDGYTGGGANVATQLEVCALARAYVGVSSGGKPVYLMKHIHDVFQPTESPGELAAVTAGLLDVWSTGVGPNDLVTISPTTGDASAAWTIDAALYTRQLRRGYIPKA